MTYRKFKADYLFTGKELAAEDSVLITTDDGTVQAIMPAAEAGEDIAQYKGLLSPGFINCHCHLELSHMKGVLPERTGLVDFLLAVIRQRNQAPAGAADNRLQEHIRSAIETAEQEMLDGGIVAVGDICNTTDTLSQKTTGRLYYHNFIETIGFLPAGAPHRFENSRNIFDTFAETLPAGANSIVPHAPYSVSPDLFRLIAGFPGNHVLTIHNQESETENTFYLSGKGDFLRLYQAMGLDVSFFTGTGKRSLESFLPYFYRQDGHAPGVQTLILVHNVATREEDLRFALGKEGIQEGSAQDRGPQLFFCLCPHANLYIGGQLPEIGLFLRHGCIPVIGTDSLASNHQLSILEEIKVLQRSYPQLSTPDLLQWSTWNGACALQLETLFGSFQPGKRPGVVLIDNLDGLRFTDRSGAQRLV